MSRLVLAIPLHWAIQPLVAKILMLFPMAVVDLLIQTHCMDWLGHCQEVLEGSHSPEATFIRMLKQ